MGRRVLTVREISFHEKWKRNDKELGPHDLLGQNLLELFQTWASDTAVEPHVDEKTQRWHCIQSTERIGLRLLLIRAKIGNFGENGEVVNIDTQEVEMQLTENQAATVICRLLLVVPPLRTSAFLMSEESSLGAAGGAILKHFRTDFREHNQDVTMQYKMSVESEAWTEHAKLKEVEVQIKARPKDLADDITTEVGTLCHIAKPEKRKWFGRSLLGKLNDKKQLAALVGVSELNEEHEVYVTMQRDGRQKKFALGDESAPRIREVLNEATEQPVEDEKFLEVCIDKAKDLMFRLNEEWQDDWGAAQKN